MLGELSIDGLEVRSLVDRRARLLLRLLALARGRPVRTAALVEALWPDTTPARPADQVSVLASRLRRELGKAAVEHGDLGYRLNYDWLDLDELATLVTAIEERLDGDNLTGAVSAARVAVSLLRGRLTDPGTDAHWAVADHVAASRLVRHARHTAAEAMLRAGDWLTALDLASVNAEEDAFDEDAARLVMRANAHGGRSAAALAVYAELRSRLAEELGTDPDSETATLHAAILRGEVTAPAPVPVPDGSVVHLVGRTSQLAHLNALADGLGTGFARVAVVSGEAGIGKTTLLRAWAEARAEAGTTVLFGTCGTLDRSAPLDVLFVALAEHLRHSADPAALLGENAPLLGPLLGIDADGPVPADRSVAEPVLGPATVYAALTAVLARVAGPGGAILVLDDAHLAGPALGEWAAFAARRRLPLLVVAAVRTAEGESFTSTDTVHLGPLDLEATAQLVGAERAEELYERSQGHPLLLSELASAPPGAVPASLVAAIERRCEGLGTGAELLRCAAVLGADLDVDLLAAVLGRPALDVLGDLEVATGRNLLVEMSGRYAFRHALVRQALAESTRPGRSALIHRAAGRVLAARPDADPLRVAEHARLGGDVAQAARSLRTAASRAAERFDHRTTADLLDESLRLLPDDETRLARARARIRLGRYADADADVLASPGSGAARFEVGAWAAYFDRRFDDAIRFARDGELAAEDDSVRTRCQIAGGRTLHARGDLGEAERLLAEANDTAVGGDRIEASAWLGVLRAHRSQCDHAIGLLRPATRTGIGVDHTSALLHALLFTGHAHALAGRPAAALASFASYTDEVERRQAPRFSGRGVNFGAWVLRNLGATDEAREDHLRALEDPSGEEVTEMRVAALEDLAEDRIVAGDLDLARDRLDEAAASLRGDLVFGWRLAMKLALLRSRLALSADSADSAGDALAGALDLARRAEQTGVPRYASVARLLGHQARAALGEPVDLGSVHRDLAAAEASVAIEAWWWAGETGARLREPTLVDRAEALAASLADASAERADSLRAEAGRRLADWRLRMR